MKDRDFKGVWIPKEIWLSKELTLQEKLFLVEIDSLDNDSGCFASNAYFADFFDLSKNRCSEIILSLKNKGLIEVDYIYDGDKKNIEKRIIKVSGTHNRVFGFSTGGIRKIEGGYSEKCEDNNTYINNTKDNKSIVGLPYQQIVEYLNNRCGTKFKHTSKKTKDLIAARYNEGWELEDFKYVIDVKAEQWEDDEKYSNFLRPETLFSNKFESYRNQKMKGDKNAKVIEYDERYGKFI